MTADEHLAEVKRLASLRLRDCTLAAKHERLALVDAGRLEKLEALATAFEAAAETAKMTRDYKDVIEQGDTYDGKRYLFERGLCGDVFQALHNLKHSAKLPIGCLARDS